MALRKYNIQIVEAVKESLLANLLQIEAGNKQKQKPVSPWAK